MPVKIVSDTGCDLPPALIEQYDIHLVPLILRFGDRDMLDSEATRQELWQRVEAGLPCETSGPPVGPYEVMFNSLVEAGHDVVCITLTGAHSVTYNSAWTASQAFPGRVEVVDGRSISLGYGIQVLEAAKLAATGAPREAVVDAVLDLRARIVLRFFLETLEQVKRGGRLDALMPLLARLGQALNIRAVLTVNDEGRISLVGPARGRRGALKRLVQDALTTAPVEQVIVGHTHSLAEAEAIADELAQTLSYPRDQIMVFEIGAVLIAHAGQGLIGVGTIRKRQSL
jgi:DegV family protein with EDD domain